ncbi:MAG: Uma2 family endonuclease [Rhodopirellula sp.]|mgnify:CR=1 FL=1|nr:Uma2 family endonuclease [Rhodopirellula sp.]
MSVSDEAKGLMPGTDAAIPGDFVCRLSVEQYHQMARAGILSEDSPLELLDGWLVPKMTKNPPHSVVTDRVRRALEQTLPAGWLVRSQEPITLSASEPEPDVAVVRGELDDYLERHPEPHEVALVVEVSDISLRRDRTTKKRLYAEAGIPLYWIVNLLDRHIEVYGDPSGPGESPDYRARRDFAATDAIPVVIDGRSIGEVAAREILR